MVSDSAVRSLALPGVLAILIGCNDVSSKPESAPKSASSIIEPEPIRARRMGEVQGCNYDPMPLLFIAPTGTYLDGTPVDELTLYALLDGKRDFDALLKAPAHSQIALQVVKGVPEKRVNRALYAASRAGFVDVTRLPDSEQKKAKRP